MRRSAGRKKVEESKRVSLRKILADPDLRRRLMVSTIQATQAREGIVTTEEQAQRAYYVVTEEENAAFFDLQKFKNSAGQGDKRHEAFVRSLSVGIPHVRHDVPRRDFLALDGSPLNYRSIALVAHIFREAPPLEPTWGIARQGKATGDDPRWLRFRWEIASRGDWVPFAKGGEFSRFYADLALVIDWKPEHREALKRSGNGLPSQELYFKPGISWPLAGGVFSARIMPEGAVFAHKGPAVFPNNNSDTAFLCGLLNSSLAIYLLKVYTTREEMGARWEVGIIKRLPVPQPVSVQYRGVSEIADSIYGTKFDWDRGNETSRVFDVPWLLQTIRRGAHARIDAALDATLELEQSNEKDIRTRYVELNELVYRLYSVPEPAKHLIEEALGPQPLEAVWPQMQGKMPEQKRMEHVWRLLSYLVKRVVEDDEDGIVPFLQVSDEIPLLERVRLELSKLLPNRDVNAIEAEINNELKKKVKGYDRVENIQDWLENVFFAYHASLYRSRPIFWHLASTQGKKRSSFAALVHYHRFDRDRMAKLRGTYLREATDVFRREAAQASKDGRTDDRLEWQARIEEADDFEKRLQRVQEGYHHGAEDYRILTPWKAEHERPKGWNPDIDDGVKVNIEPLQRAGVLRVSEVV
jgi:hypothetical protein